MIGPGVCVSTSRAMARANSLPDGMTAPVDSGFSIQERRNWTSSSIRRVFLARLGVF